MMRIKAIDRRKAGLFARVSLWLARRKMRQLTGREPEGMIEPVEAYAHVPRLLFGYAMLEEATAKLHRVDERLKLLAELKAATLTQCEWCIDIGSQLARRGGVTEEQLLALPRYRDSELFDDLEKLVLDYAVGVSSTPVSVTDELFVGLRSQFDDAQLVELTNIIALENKRGRFTLALGMGAAGFSEGMVCAVPEIAGEQIGAASAAAA
jgi:4-carboxymuconolactone decarboxylase